jgi:hypothetical protein
MSLPRFLVPSLVLSLVACGGQEIDTGHTTHETGSGGGGGAAATTSTTTDVGGGGAGTRGAPAGLADVALVYGGSSTKVDVAKLPTQPYKGAEVVPLSAVWSTGGLAPDVASLVFDFEGDDGFHPSMKANCQSFVTGAQLAQGYILPETRTLVWDDALGFPGCYSVKAVAKIIGLDAP